LVHLPVQLIQELQVQKRIKPKPHTFITFGWSGGNGAPAAAIDAARVDMQDTDDIIDESLFPCLDCRPIVNHDGASTEHQDSFNELKAKPVCESQFLGLHQTTTIRFSIPSMWGPVMCTRRKLVTPG
jgi:hypothetical protein